MTNITDERLRDAVANLKECAKTCRFAKTAEDVATIEAALAELAELRKANQWRPIESASKLKKGFMRAYSFEPSSTRQGEAANPKSSYYLRRAFQFEPNMGARVCDLFIDIPTPTREGEQP